MRLDRASAGGTPGRKLLVEASLGPMHVQENGQPDAMTMVLLHALGTDGTLWSPQVVRFAQSYRLLCPDLWGHGFSRPPKDDRVTIDKLVDALEAVVDLAGPGRCVLVGTSLGAVMALAGVERLTNRISALVLVGAKLVRGGGADIEMRNRSIAVRQQGLDGIAESMIARWFPTHPSPLRSATVERVRDMLSGTDPSAYAALASASSCYDLTKTLRSCKQPVLLVSGALDEDIPTHFDAMRSAAPHVAHVCIDGAGHFPSLEKPDVFNAAVEHFLSHGQHGRSR